MEEKVIKQVVVEKDTITLTPSQLSERLEREKTKAYEKAQADLIAKQEQDKKEEELAKREEALRQQEENKKLETLKKQFEEAGGNVEEFEIASKLFNETEDGKIDMELAVNKFGKTDKVAQDLNTSNISFFDKFSNFLFKSSVK